MWVIPGRGSLCYLDTRFAGGCAVTLTGPDSPDAVGVIGGGGSAGVERLNGVVPDGNPTVSVALADGTVMKVRVLDNVFSAAIRPRRTAERSL